MISKTISQYFIITQLFFQITISAQTNFEPIKSEGKIPEEIILTPDKQYDKLVKSISEKTHKGKNVELEFYENSVYLNDFLFKSGKVLFNTKLNTIIDKIADRILSDHSKLRSQLTFYILKSDKLNAFTLNNGIIFINIGLLAHIETEAQLAFVISHEIVHYVKQHVLNGYINKKKIIEGKENFKDLNYDQKRISISMYSKQMEIIADSIGFDYFVKAGYNPEEAEKTLYNSLFEYCNFESDSLAFDFLEVGPLKLPNKYLLNSVRNIKITEEKKDIFSSHPNIGERISLIQKYKEHLSDNSDKNFISCTEKEIIELKEKSRFEIVHLYLENTDYEKAILFCYFLKKDYPENEFLDIATAISLYQIASYMNNNDFEDIHHKADNQYYSMHQISYLFEKLPPLETTILAVNYLWNLKIKYPRNEIITNLSDKTIEQLVYNFNHIIKNNRDESNLGSDFVSQTIDWLMKNSEFEEIYNNYNIEKERHLKEKEELIRDEKKRKEIAKKNKLIRINGRALGIDKIVIVNPMCIIVNKGETDFNWTNVEKFRNQLINAIINNSQNTELQLDILDIKSIDSTEISTYNDYSLVSEWYSEKCSHSSNKYFQYSSNYTKNLIEKYKTGYFAWVGLMTFPNNDLFNNKQSLVLFNLFDIETGDLVLSRQQYSKGYTNQAGIDRFINKVFSQIKNQRNL